MFLQLAGPQQDLADGADRGLAVKQRYCFLLTWPGKENRHCEQSQSVEGNPVSQAFSPSLLLPCRESGPRKGVRYSLAAAEATAVNDASSLAAPLGNLLGYNQCSVPSSLDHPVSHMFNHSITQNAECPLSLSLFSHCFHSLQIWRKRQERRVHSYSHSTNIPSFFPF